MGLLDLMNPEARQGLLMLGAAGPSPVPQSFGQRLLGVTQQLEAEKRAEEERKQKAAMQALQAQLIHAQIGDRVAEQAERERARGQSMRDEEILRRFVSPLQGPTQDGASLSPTFDPRSMISQGMSLPGAQNAIALNQAMQKPEVPLLKAGPGDQFFDPRNPSKPVFSAPHKPDDVKPTELSRLLQEMGALPPGNPMRKVYLDQITKMTTHAPGVSVTYGAPMAGVGPDGQPVFFAPPKDPTKSGPVILPGVRPPAGADKKPTEFEAKAGLYFKSMQQASQTLSQIEETNGWRPSMAEAVTPDKAGNLVRSGPRQAYVQAQRQWIDSINRVRSGANLPELEYTRAVKTFFPEFNDGESIRRQKAAARAQEETAMAAAAGPALRGVTPQTIDWGSLK